MNDVVGQTRVWIDGQNKVLIESNDVIVSDGLLQIASDARVLVAVTACISTEYPAKSKDTGRVESFVVVDFKVDQQAVEDLHSHADSSTTKCVNNV